MKKPFEGFGTSVVTKFKKLFYKNRLSGLKRMLSILLVGGILASVVYVTRHTYIEYAVSKAHVTLLYPEIAQAKYPDGSRFTYYDLISEDKLQKALDIMAAKGKYLNFTPEDLREKFYVYNYLDGPAQAAVSSERSAGNDYSYVANEYIITFVQPHDYKNKNVIKKFISADESMEFLEALMEVNRREIADTYGRNAGFANLTDMGDTSNYDYSEIVGIYRAKINSVIKYLNDLEDEAPGFVSEKYGKSIKDLVGEYRLLFINTLDSIASFIDTSAISRDIEVASNKLNVNIENNVLKLNKYTDKVAIHKYAQEAYDHTFTENLIVVAYNRDDGLYQARPKTAFDTVVDRKHEAVENVANYDTTITVLTNELNNYSTAVADDAEYSRLMEKCGELISAFEEDYKEITSVSKDVVEEFSNRLNKSYLKYDVKESHIVSRGFIVKTGIAFCLGIMAMFMLYVVLSLYGDRKKMKAKEKMLRKIQKEERGV